MIQQEEPGKSNLLAVTSATIYVNQKWSEWSTLNKSELKYKKKRSPMCK